MHWRLFQLLWSQNITDSSTLAILYFVTENYQMPGQVFLTSVKKRKYPQYPKWEGSVSLQWTLMVWGRFLFNYTMSVLSVRERVPCTVRLKGALLLGLKSISQKQWEWEWGTQIKDIYVQITLTQHHKSGCKWYKHYHKQLTTEIWHTSSAL